MKRILSFGGIGLFIASNLIAADFHPDLSTPKSAGASFVRALESGDVNAVKAVTLGSETDYRLMEVLAAADHAGKELERAAIEKFGDAGKEVASLGAGGNSEKDLADSRVKEDGDSAVLARKDDPDAKHALKLKRVDGAWKIDLAALPNKKDLIRAVPAMRATAGILVQAARDIRAGKYKSADEAKQVILKQLIGSGGPTTTQAPR